MKLIDWLQVIFLLISFVIGLRIKPLWLWWIAAAVVLEILFGVIVYVLLLDNVAWLSILDMLYDHKELWLLEFTKNVGAWFGYKVRWRIDYSFYLMCALSGALSHFLLMLPGGIWNYVRQKYFTKS